MNNILADCAKFTSQFEGCRLQAYRDSVGVLTIGYGTTENVTSNMVITESQALEFLQNDLTKALYAVKKLIKTSLNPNQIIALCDFVYNLGAGSLKRSTLRMKLNRNELDEVPKEFLRYNKAGGRILKGLTKRRYAEAQLFKY
jgi:lysozyme